MPGNPLSEEDIEGADHEDPFEGLEEIADEINVYWNLEQAAGDQNVGDLLS